MDLKLRADMLLGGAAASGAVPGVIAMATNREGTIYEGGFRAPAMIRRAKSSPSAPPSSPPAGSCAYSGGRRCSSARGT